MVVKNENFQELNLNNIVNEIVIWKQQIKI